MSEHDRLIELLTPPTSYRSGVCLALGPMPGATPEQVETHRLVMDAVARGARGNFEGFEAADLLRRIDETYASEPHYGVALVDAVRTVADALRARTT